MPKIFFHNIWTNCLLTIRYRYDIDWRGWKIFCFIFSCSFILPSAHSFLKKRKYFLLRETEVSNYSWQNIKTKESSVYHNDIFRGELAEKCFLRRTHAECLRGYRTLTDPCLLRSQKADTCLLKINSDNCLFRSSYWSVVTDTQAAVLC